jgi:hypothetical protein
MIYKNSRGIFCISSFESLPVTAAYSSRAFDDMRTETARDAFLGCTGFQTKNLIMARQIHGVRVARVGSTDRGNMLPDVDGLVYKKDTGAVVLGVTFADCVPLLAVDPDASVIGVAHAGWRGTLHGIAGELIRSIVKEGGSAKNIRISIGPHIGMCCYTVAADRARAFQDRFGENEKIASQQSDGWHVDIGYANYNQLLDAGIQKDHIDAPVTCTSCQSGDFYSFRKDPKSTFGVQLGIIGF